MKSYISWLFIWLNLVFAVVQAADWEVEYHSMKDFNAIWGSAPNDIFVVGEGGIIVHYDGNQWSTMNSGTSSWLLDIWGTSSTDVFAAVTDSTILHYDGNQWSTMNSGTTFGLYGFWGTSGTDVFAVGWSGTIVHYDGNSWTPMNSGTNLWLSGIWGTSNTDIFAVGESGTILHYDSKQWNTMNSGISSLLNEIWGTSSTDVFAVGTNGTIVHYDGKQWNTMNSGITSNIWSIWGSSSTNVFAVGESGTILHYDGNSWTTINSETDHNSWIMDIWGIPSTDILAKGNLWIVKRSTGEAILRLHCIDCQPKTSNLQVTPKSYNYGNIAVGNQASNTFTISNISNNEVQLQTLVLANTIEFTLNNDACSNVLLTPAETCQVTVNFQPQSAGTQLTKLTLPNDLETIEVPLSGTGFSTPIPDPSIPTPDPSTPIPDPSNPTQPLPPTMNLTLYFGGNGHGHVTTAPNGIDCNNNQTDCTHFFKTATWINLTATPANDSQFTGWSGNQTDCEDGVLFMSGSRSCTAYFELLRFPLTVTTVGQGQINSDPVGIHCGDQCQSRFDINTNITLTAIPAKGWQFQEWSGDCNDQGTVIIKASQACQATFTQLPPDYPPVADTILTTCANAIPWDGQTNEEAVVKNTGTLNLISSATPIKIKALCNYGTLQATGGEILTIQVNSTEGFIYNKGNILGQNGQSSTAKSTIPTNLVNAGDNGSSIKLQAGTQLYHQGTIQAGVGGNGYFTAGHGGSVEIYADQIIQAGIIAAGNGGEGNAHQPAWDGFGDYFGDLENTSVYGNQPVWGGNGGKTLLQAEQSLYASAVATTSSGTGGNAYVWCQNGAHLIDWEFDGRWYAGTCVSNDANLPVAIPTPGIGGDLILLSPNLNDVSQASSGNALYYEPSTITLGTTTQLHAQQDIVIFGGDDWVLDLRHLSVGAISTPGNITLAVGKNSTIDLRGNTGKVFQAGGQFTVFTDTLLLSQESTLADLVDAKEGIATYPSKILHQVILTATKQLTGEPQATLPLELELINGGPEADVYNLTVNDLAGWMLSTLPSPISVAGLGHETQQLNITLPAMAGEQDTITVTATSAAEPSVTSTAQIVVKVAGEPNASATNSVTVNQPPISTENIGVVNNSEPAVDRPVELPPITESDSSIVLAIDPFSSLPPSTPPCYASGIVDWLCNAKGQKLTDLTVGPNGMIAFGTLIGNLINQGWVSNLTLESNSHLTGGIVTGYIDNHGEMADFEFRGAAIEGGMLAGKISNTSQVGGYFRDVQLAAGTQLSGGNLQGNISGDYNAPALLENVTIKSGSSIAGVKLGDGVIVEDNVTCGDNVQAPAGVCQSAPSSKPKEPDLPNLGATAFTQDGAIVSTHAAIHGGITVSSGPLASPATVTLADEVTIQGQIQVDPTQVGQAGEVVVYLEYTPIGAHEPVYIMLNESGEPMAWDNNLAQLAPFQVIPKLAELIDVPMYQGKLPVTGTLKIGLGYRLADGLVVHNLKPIEVNISQ